MRPESLVPHIVEHFGVYLVTCLAFGFGYASRPMLLAILLVVFSGLVEIVQLSVPSRHARLSDFIVDALAALIGVSMGWWISTTQRRSDVSNQTL